VLFRSPVRLLDLKAGSELKINDRTYTIRECDGFTKKIFNELGTEFGRQLPLPGTYMDPAVTRSPSPQRVNSELFSPVLRPCTSESKAFFQNGDVVLRFFGIWDDRTNLYGVQKRVRIHFYPNDNTMELLEDFKNNDGRDHIPVLMKRTKVPKVVYIDASQPHLAFTLEEKPRDDEAYSEYDFQIGSFVIVAGMDIQILDADSTTRKYYRAKGIPLSMGVDVEEPTPQRLERYVPPYNGYGSEEDSLQTCTGKLVLSPPKKNTRKTQHFVGQVLRFRASMVTTNTADQLRTFVMQLFMEDDTFQIREPPARNSGFLGGMFMAREPIKDETGRLLTSRDVTVGALIHILGNKFRIEEADEFSLKFMEAHPDVWPQCHLPNIIYKLSANEGSVLRLLLTSTGSSPRKEVSYDELERLFARASVFLTKQESLTLLRALDRQRKGSVKLSKLIALMKMDQQGGALDF